MPQSELPPLCAQQDFRGRLLLLAPEPPETCLIRDTIPRFRTSRTCSPSPHRRLFYPRSTLSHPACLHPIPLSPRASFPNSCSLSQHRPTSSVWTACSSHRGAGGRGQGEQRVCIPKCLPLGGPLRAGETAVWPPAQRAAVEPLTPVQPAPLSLTRLKASSPQVA